MYLCVIIHTVFNLSDKLIIQVQTIVIYSGDKVLSKITLKVRNLTKMYGTRAAVDNISFEVYEGEIFGFLGPNGSGKSTTIKCITGLAKPTSGKINICGYSITKDFEKAIACVGGIIETPEMYKSFKGIDNLKYYASLYPNITKEKINEVVNLVGMQNRINDRVKTYSLGMKQRLGIAQALLHNPKLLILDEPTNGLDPNGILEMRNFLKQLAHKKKIAILISSHIIAEMELICDTIGIIDNGKLIKVKTVDQFKQLEKNKKVKAQVSYPNYSAKLILDTFNPNNIEVKGNEITFALGEEKIPEIIKLLSAKGISIYAITAITKSLEDIFLETLGTKLLTHSSIK